MRKRQFPPTHPGEMLRLDFLPDYRLTAAEFAASIQLPLERVEALLAGTHAVDAEIALRLARFFGNSPEFWMALQRDADFFDAQEVLGAEIDSIVPVDPSNSAYLQEREPLPAELAEELRQQLADIEDTTRWVISSALFGEDPINDESVMSTFYDVCWDAWAVGIEHGTAFKREWAARAVAEGLRDGVQVLAVGPERLARAARIEAGDHVARKRYLHRSRMGPSLWHPEELLRTEEDMVAYLELAVEEATPGLLGAAVNDVIAAMRNRYQAVPAND